MEDAVFASKRLFLTTIEIFWMDLAFLIRKRKILSLDLIYLLQFLKYTCKNCVDLLKKRMRLKDELAKVNEKLKLKYNKKYKPLTQLLSLTRTKLCPYRSAHRILEGICYCWRQREITAGTGLLLLGLLHNSSKKTCDDVLVFDWVTKI